MEAHDINVLPTVDQFAEFCHRITRRYGPEPWTDSEGSWHEMRMQRGMASPSEVLVVDDDDAIRRLVMTVLQRNGYRCAEARNGDEAIHLMNGAEYSAIVLDLMMPVRNGYEVLEYMTEHNVERECVVVMTAAGTRGTKDLHSPLIHSILFKPFDLEDIVGAVNECVGSQNGSSPQA